MIELLKSNTFMNIGNRPMVLLPLDIYEKITKNINKLHFTKKRNTLAIISESSLSKDWLKPEEEKTWKNL